MDALVLAVIEHQTDGILEDQEPLLSNLDSNAVLRKWRDLLVAHQQRGYCALSAGPKALSPVAI